MIRYRIKHTQNLAANFSQEDKQRLVTGGFNGVCLNQQFRDRFKEGFPAYEIEHVDKNNQLIDKVLSLKIRVEAEDRTAADHSVVSDPSRDDFSL